MVAGAPRAVDGRGLAQRRHRHESRFRNHGHRLDGRWSSGRKMDVKTAYAAQVDGPNQPLSREGGFLRRGR
jgi:hypothetical protein